MKFKKSLGQVFLRDKGYLKRIVDSFNFTEDDTVIEIGPGSGVVTRHIYQKVSKLICVERDLSLKKLLDDRFASDTVEIVTDDILNYDFNKFETKVKVFGNVPYYISNKLIYFLVENKEKIDTVFLTLQKEFAQKLTSQTGSKQYGALSCFVNYFADTKLLFNIPKTAFYPVPKVDSAFVSLKFIERDFLSKEEQDKFFKMIKYAFSARRKKLINNLCALYDKDKLCSVFDLLSISCSVRPEQISLENYLNIFNRLL